MSKKSLSKLIEEGTLFSPRTRQRSIVRAAGEERATPIEDLRELMANALEAEEARTVLVVYGMFGIKDGMTPASFEEAQRNKFFEEFGAFMLKELKQ